MKNLLLEKFLALPEYQALKKQVEQTTFKLLGDYQIIQADQTLCTLPANKMKEQYKNRLFTITNGYDKETGSPIMISKSFYDIWSEDVTMREYSSTTFDCDIASVPSNVYNMFTGFNNFDGVASGVCLDDIFDHFQSLCGYNYDIFKYYMNWLAHLKQKPHEHMQTCFVIISEEGIGKDIAFSFLSEVFGNQYCLGTDKLDHVCGKFNGNLGGKVLIMINEANPTETRERQENIKFLITAEKVTIEKKYREPVTVKMYARFMFFSNRLTAFPVQKGSRRPVIVKGSNKYLPINFGVEESVAHFDALRAQMKDPRYQKAFSQYLQKIDLSTWNMKDVPKSELHQDLEECAQSPLVDFMADFARNMQNPTSEMNSTKLYVEFTEYLQKMKMPFQFSHTRFGIELSQHFQVEKIKKSSNYYIFNREKLIEILEKKYGYDFQDHKEAIEEYEKEIEEEKQIVVEVPQPNSEIAELRKLIEQQQKIIESLQQQLSQPKPEPIPEPKPEPIPEPEPVSIEIKTERKTDYTKELKQHLSNHKKWEQQSDEYYMSLDNFLLNIIKEGSQETYDQIMSIRNKLQKHKQAVQFEEVNELFHDMLDFFN